MSDDEINDRRRHVLAQYFDASVARDVDRLANHLTKDLHVWLVPSVVKLGVPRPIEGRDAFLAFVRARAASSSSWTARSFTPMRLYFDGNDVAAHMRLIGDMTDGAVYDNEYVFLFTFDGDRISEMREFTDTSFIHDFISEHSGAE